jgi:hypothetical protein
VTFLLVVAKEKKALPGLKANKSKEQMNKSISVTNQQPFISIFDQILSLKKLDPTADTTALEKEIDRLVYDLYGLTEEVVAIIENG